MVCLEKYRFWIGYVGGGDISLRGNKTKIWDFLKMFLK